MAKKVRRIGCPSSSAPIADTPAWTIDKEWEKGKLYRTYIPVLLVCCILFHPGNTTDTHAEITETV